ncbi:hypothetical protein SBOR_7991 [Sclerotinia borealis F-4128]|uniref:Uncharacterized protein n=1 Tax=Sclerotinia borealis (strain F-4128) TaxID=1432307 RepID=W9C9T3_SCLBF|nr:hypothetical protein SBOR_7991 [Sclerotinia borealis F-4128]
MLTVTESLYRTATRGRNLHTRLVGLQLANKGIARRRRMEDCKNIAYNEIPREQTERLATDTKPMVEEGTRDLGEDDEEHHDDSKRTGAGAVESRSGASQTGFMCSY